MMKITVPILAGMTLLLAACARPATECLVIKPLDLSRADAVEDWTFDNIARVRSVFEVDPDHERTLGSYTRLEDYDGETLLAQDGPTGTVMRLDEGGRILSSFSRRGRGPQEYLSAFGRYNDQGQIVMRDFQSAKELTFLPDGTFVSRRDSSALLDIHCFPDGSYAALVYPQHARRGSSMFALYTPEGELVKEGPEGEVSLGMILLNSDAFFPSPDGTCYFKRDITDTVFHLFPTRYEAVAYIDKPKEDLKIEEPQSDGSTLIGNRAGRVTDRSLLVLGDKLFYNFRDTDRGETFYTVWDLRKGTMLYLSQDKPTVQIGEVRHGIWPDFVRGKDFWVRMSVKTDADILPGYDLESNSAFIHLTMK